MKDLIINKEDPIAEADRQDVWEFKEAEEFFRKRN